MKKIFLLFILSVFTLGAYSLSSSKDENPEFDTQFKNAMKLVFEENYKDALYIINALRNTEPNNMNLEFYAGLCKFYLMFDKNHAVDHFAKSSKSLSEKYVNIPSEKSAPVEAIYFNALSNHYMGNYDIAKTLYEEYIDKSKAYKAEKRYVKDAERKIEFCQNPSLLYSEEDESEIREKRKTMGVAKQDLAYKNKLSKSLEAMEKDHFEGLLKFKEMAKEYPNDPNVNYFMGIAMLNHAPHKRQSIEYFENSDKFINSADRNSGMACPSLNEYYTAVAHQMNGNHEEAVKHFENFEKVYPEKYTPFKNDFDEKLAYSRSFLTDDQLANEMADDNVIKKELVIKVKRDFSIVFPEIKDRVKDGSTNKGAGYDRIEHSVSGYYYTVQIGEGFMNEEYFEKAGDFRVFRGRNSKYPRYLVGKFANNSDAQNKLNELKGLGYEDAFITKFKGAIH